MATVATPTQSVVKLSLNDGTLPSGQTKVKSMNLFSSTIMKSALDSSGLDAAMAVIGFLEPCLAKTLNSVSYQATSGLTEE